MEVASTKQDFEKNLETTLDSRHLMIISAGDPHQWGFWSSLEEFEKRTLIRIGQTLPTPFSPHTQSPDGMFLDIPNIRAMFQSSSRRQSYSDLGGHARQLGHSTWIDEAISIR
jgi:hypothetical protein